MCVQYFIHKAVSPSSFTDRLFYIIHTPTHLAFGPQPLCYDRTQKKLRKNSDKPISSHVYHPWQVSPCWTGSRQRVPWTTQQQSQQPTTQRISFMPNVKLSKCPPPHTAFLKDTYSTARSYLEISSPPPIHWVVTTACSLQQSQYFREAQLPIKMGHCTHFSLSHFIAISSRFAT